VLATITVMSLPTDAGGGALLPGSVLQSPGQSERSTFSAKPLNAAGAGPAL
jgi:hypothetical protein